MQKLEALEACLIRKRRVGERLFDIDAYEHWGAPHASKEERARAEADEARALADHEDVVRELTALVERLRRDEPAVIAQWAELHIAYLRGLPSDDSPVKLVADDECEAWAAVARGEKPFVEENVYYVKIDPARYEATFGFPPP